MSFASSEFLFVFLPLAVVLLGVSSVFAQKALFVPAIILTSTVFYGASSIPHLLLLLGLIFTSWIAAQAYVRFRPSKIAGHAITVGVLFNLSALLVWKYGDSLVETWNSFGTVQVNEPGLLMPLGISFYVFQQIGYLLDLKKGRTEASQLYDHLAFVMFFPQLLAGPIVTHKRMMKQFRRVKGGITLSERLDMATLGIAWFSIGLFKKVVLADGLARLSGPLMSNAVFGELTVFEAWQLAIVSPPRVYFDFCGYSEMAIGLGLMFGMKLPVNFNAPFRADNLRDGWSRWHITFHHFIRDHIYAPVKRATIKWPLSSVISLFLATTLSSLWHGASLHYFFWGILIWVMMYVSGANFSFLPNIVRHIVLIILSVGLCLTASPLITAPDMQTALIILRSMLAIETAGILPAQITITQIGTALIILFAAVSLRFEVATQLLLSEHSSHNERTFFGIRPPAWAPNFGWMLFCAVLLCVSFYFVDQSPPFIYFQF